MTGTGALSIGVAAAVGPELAARLAPAIEAAGFHALWVNDTPGNDALAVLAAAARETESLVLATGVVPVDRRPPAEILDRVSALALPEDRLLLGIGSGGRREGALALVADAAAALRAGSSARVVVGALGPKMRRLGAAASDGLLLSWLTPDVAARQTDAAHEVAADAHVAVYVRTALDADAGPRLEREAAAYASYPAYAANFARLGIEARDTVIRPDQGARIAAYRASADEVVLRAITAGETADDYLRFVDAAGAAAAAR